MRLPKVLFGTWLRTLTMLTMIYLFENTSYRAPQAGSEKGYGLPWVNVLEVGALGVTLRPV